MVIKVAVLPAEHVEVTIVGKTPIHAEADKVGVPTVGLALIVNVTGTRVAAGLSQLPDTHPT